MSSTNVSIVDGYLGRDSELTFSQAGFAFLNFSVAVKSQVKIGERYEDRTDWIDVKVLGKRAEGLAKILVKGTFCVVSGRLQQETWEDKDTRKKRSKIVLLADNVSLGPRPANSGDRPAVRESSQSGGYDGEGPSSDDDIPF